MLGNKRGLSTIVVTLIIILISLVAVGIVWVVVRNLINSGTNQASVQYMCNGVDMEATALPICTGTGGMIRLCSVTIQRQGTGNDVMGGVKLSFENATSGVVSPLVYTFAGNVAPMGVVNGSQITQLNTTINTADTLVVSTYFIDTSGNQYVCQNPTSFRLTP